MRIHELKTIQPYFDQVEREKKKFEVRKNDRNFKVDDYVLLREYNHHDKCYTYNSILVKITYLLDSEEYVKEGFVIFGFNIVDMDIEISGPF